MVRETTDTTVEAAFGRANDATSGFNVFDVPSIGDFALRNDRTEELVMENNEWETNSEVDIEASISGSGDFEPFLALGSSILTSALFINIVDASTQVGVTNCTIEVLETGFDGVTENVAGIYAYPSILEGSYTVHVTAFYFDEVMTEVTVSSGSAQMVKTIPVGLGTGGGSGISCYSAPGASGHSSGGADWLVLSAVAFLLILMRVRGVRKDA